MNQWAVGMVCVTIVGFVFALRSGKRGRRKVLRSVICLGMAGLLALFSIHGGNTPVEAEGTPDPGGFLNIMPPGQNGVANFGDVLAFLISKKFPKHFNDQTQMYESLIGRSPTLTEDELTRYFKVASLGVEGKPERTYSPQTGVTVERDGFGVPHIEGETREATMFAVGYVTAEDRLFMMDVLRHLGRAQLSQFLGDSERNRRMDEAQLKVAPYTEADLTRQAQELCAQGTEGAQVCEDMEAYVAGINAYIKKARLNPKYLPGEYVALFKIPQKWKMEDSVAIASLVGGIFGKGGGEEVAAGKFLSQLQQKHGEKEGRRIWEDFRSAEDPETPVTIRERFPYQEGHRVDSRSTALLDLETVDQTLKEMEPPEMKIDGPMGPIDLRVPDGMSNAILVGGKHTEAGRPIAVFGPQTSYFSPQLLTEVAVRGPGIEARGVGFAGVNLYVQMGRGRDFSWSATSAGADNVDQWVVKLCEPAGGKPTLDSKGYLYKGECRPMETLNHTQQTAPWVKKEERTPRMKTKRMNMKVNRTLYGPVSARGTVKGEPVAVVTQRSTYMKELNSAIGFKRVNDPRYMSGGAASFQRAFDRVDYTFNWFYVDKQDIAYKHSCLCPVRDKRTDPDLPTWGNGEYDWSGEFLKPEQQPRVINPKQGYLVNWNNKQAPGFRANDEQFSYGSIHRSDLLEKRLKAAVESGNKLTRADMVNIMADAATVDLKGQEVYPWVLKVLGEKAPGGDPVLQEMRDRLARWVETGGHRRDLAGNDGKYDHAVAIAIGDAYFKRLAKAMFDPVLAGADLPNVVEDYPSQGLGSAFNAGYYTYVHKDLRQVLGGKVKGPWHRSYCGEGDLNTCRDTLWKALEATAGDLQQTYGSAYVNNWVYDATKDEIIQEPLGAVEAPRMRWMNRPTFQQVVQVGVPIRQ